MRVQGRRGGRKRALLRLFSFPEQKVRKNFAPISFLSSPLPFRLMLLLLSSLPLSLRSFKFQLIWLRRKKEERGGSEKERERGRGENAYSMKVITALNLQQREGKREEKERESLEEKRWEFRLLLLLLIPPPFPCKERETKTPLSFLYLLVSHSLRYPSFLTPPLLSSEVWWKGGSCVRLSLFLSAQKLLLPLHQQQRPIFSPSSSAQAIRNRLPLLCRIAPTEKDRGERETEETYGAIVHLHRIKKSVFKRASDIICESLFACYASFSSRGEKRRGMLFLPPPPSLLSCSDGKSKEWEERKQGRLPFFLSFSPDLHED